MKVFSVAEIVSAEKAANANNHPYATMMELAGRGVAEAIRTRYNTTAKSVLVLCGPGNNGGDGLVAAHYLAKAGATVAVYTHNVPGNDKNLARVRQGRIAILTDKAALFDRLEQAELIVDALLGTGVSRPISGMFATILDMVKMHSVAPVVAVDCPSGLNCDTGAIDPHALSAELTVTFAGPKQGHYLFPGCLACGDLITIDIGIDPTHEKDAVVDLATDQSTATLLPDRPRDGHKGTFGTTLIVGGSADYLGAPVLSARAALRIGSGLVGLAVPQALRQLGAIHLPEATFPKMPDVETLSVDSVRPIADRFARTHALLVGPGLGRDSDDFLHTLFAQSNLPPLVVDADGLNYLAQQPDWWRLLPPNTILTPHPAEMGRLVGRDIRSEQRFELACMMAQRWGHVVVLKGAYTVVASPAGPATLIPIATPALAVAGSGDVLAGAIAGLLAQRLTPYAAAVAGAYVHAAAGQRLAEAGGNSGHLASEIAEALQPSCHRLRMI